MLQNILTVLSSDLHGSQNGATNYSVLVHSRAFFISYHPTTLHILLTGSYSYVAENMQLLDNTFVVDSQICSTFYCLVTQTVSKALSQR